MTEDELLAGGLLIGDEWVHDSAGGTLEHVNPATGAVQARFPVAGRAEVDRAVSSAREAMTAWRVCPSTERAAALQRLAGLLRAHSDDFGRVTMLENGTPITMARTHAGTAARWFEYYAGWIDKITGSVIPADGAFNYSAYEPCGVVAIILTWNGPTGSIGMKAAAALAAGCCVVLKPPELAPFSSTLFGRLALEAGLPAGVLNVIAGGPEASDHLVRHPGIDKISFTGSPVTGARIQAACAESLTPLVLELGGKSANIVLEDADLEKAVRHAATGVAALCGQVCVAPTRLIVQRSVYDQVLDGVVETITRLPVGDPADPTTFVGPLISARARGRVLGVIHDAKAAGYGRVVAGGDVPAGLVDGGFYVSPTVFADVDNVSPLAQEEAFGPVLSVMPAESPEEAVAIANDTRYGLAAYLHTRDLGHALRLASALDAGNVGINGGTAVASPASPFGGFKDSGYGKEGGFEGLVEYLRVKNVNING